MASVPSPPESRPSVSNRRRGRATSSLVALLLAAACVPTAAAQERPAPDPQELWRQFPLDDARSQQAPTVDAPQLRERPTPVSSTEAGESTGDDLPVLGFAAITLATAIVIALATGMLATLRGRVSLGLRLSANAPGSRPTDPGGRTQPGRQMDELQTLKAKREANKRAAETSASSIDDVEALKAKLSVPAKRKEVTTNDDLEVLKSKRESAASATKPDDPRSEGVDALKAKLERLSVAKRERPERQAIDRLRTKLREGPDSSAVTRSDVERPRAKLEVVPGGPAAALDARPTPANPPSSLAQGRANRSGRRPRGGAAVALVSQYLGESAEPVESQPRVRCRVEVWCGYVKSQFYAIEQRTTRAPRVIAESPRFRMRGGSPVPQEGAPADAHATLIEKLERDGWCVVGRGPRWFDVELERAEGPPLRGLPER